MEGKLALIVDDEPDIRELLEITLGRMNIETRSAENVGSARRFLAEETFDLCLTDMQLPDGNGLEIVDLIAKDLPSLPVAVITAFGNMDTAISALKAGAFDFVQKPVDLEQLRSLVETALRIGSMDEADDKVVRMLGQSQAMNNLRGQIAKLARSQAPIYISGESGSGKEVAARRIHEQGPRAAGPFVPVNCGAIPTELMESEFFGHVKGSFTGAVADKEGLFRAAEGGTLFLDEVADLPLSMQVKLLRAIQEKAIRPVGAHGERAIDVRILSATHKDLVAQVESSNFRQDLYYRLNVIELAIPSLRDRPEDISLHVDEILNRLAKEYGQPSPEISHEAHQLLNAYAFPGNVRELENVLERAFTLCENGRVEAQDLQLGAGSMDANTTQHIGSTSPHEEIAATGAANSEPDQSSTVDDQIPLKLQPGESLEAFLEKIERQLIVDALESTRWNKTAAAKELGITFRALRYRLKKLELE